MGMNELTQGKGVKWQDEVRVWPTEPWEKMIFKGLVEEEEEPAKETEKE